MKAADMLNPAFRDCIVAVTATIQLDIENKWIPFAGICKAALLLHRHGPGMCTISWVASKTSVEITLKAWKDRPKLKKRS